MPNLYVILVLFMGLFMKRKLGVVFGFAFGLYLDIILGKTVGISAFALGAIGLIGEILSKNFSKDSRMTIIFMVFGSTIIFEIASYFMKYIIYSMNVEIFNFIIILLIEILYNIILTIILYPLMQKFGYYIENEYKGNKILTRYF